MSNNKTTEANPVVTGLFAFVLVLLLAAYLINVSVQGLGGHSHFLPVLGLLAGSRFAVFATLGK